MFLIVLDQKVTAGALNVVVSVVVKCLRMLLGTCRRSDAQVSRDQSVRV